MTLHDVFVTGGTGYLGLPLIDRLIQRGHSVRALVRAGSQHKLPRGAQAVPGDALDATTFSAAIPPADTLVHLVGTPHPDPRKAQAFRDIDLTSIRASVAASVSAGVRHVVYVSVAQPAPVMHAYVAVRAEGEALIRASGIAATFLRPWYVLGPGHRWPVLLSPLSAVLERLPATRDAARRLGLVTLEQMAAGMVCAVERAAVGVQVVDVAQIRAAVRGI